ncbi:hypothetical protein ACOMHN_017005 [Nucella lapillus]
METRKFVLVSIALTVVFQQVCLVGGEHNDITFTVAAGAIECFFYSVKQGSSVEAEYQVIDGGELDIDFTVQAPDGEIVHSDEHKGEGQVSVPVGHGGDYKFCFDNSFSHMSSKTVFFEYNPDEDDRSDEDHDWKFDMDEVKDMLDMTFEEIKGVIDRSRGNLDKSIQIQTVMKMHEARDRNMLEANLSRVNIFSAFQVFVMLTVSLTQVLMIRNLFEEKGYYSRIGLRRST